MSSPPDLGALDPAVVAQRFGARRAVREHVRWTPEVGCEAVFRLDGDGLGVVTVGREGVSERTFRDDPALPGLAPASSPAVVGPWLGAGGACSVRPVSYRPGERCVLRYGLATSTLYGKVVAGDRADRLARVVRHLAARRLTPPVLAVSSEWGLVVQADAGPRAGPDELHAVGAVLASLHAAGGPPAPSRSLADDVAELDPFGPLVGRDDFRAAVARLRRVPEGRSPLVASHGSFHPGQVHHGPVLIDLDSFAWAEPERDAGNLLAYLRWRAIRGGHDGRRAFLDGYGRGRLDSDRLRAYEAASLLKIAGRRYRRLETGMWPLVPELIAAARRLTR